MTLTLTKIPASDDVSAIAADLRARIVACEFRDCTPETRHALAAHLRMLELLADDVAALEMEVKNPDTATVIRPPEWWQLRVTERT